ncbi:MAG: hypothetical protein P0Y49_21195 [Candidatus Pedobacter colombiensis]|uniref:Uncharacterized protein n=1 Tax=Candidatus Pedobacter colombiensis TaxID=3121371 RepID=A0AAJ5W819_9SPHI|nr:hypothetical protein [Pedobacter sp.]WEK19295.1 MAG: hypothetical protein P0Y49_21195 [Pedobacter sp.]
MGDKEAPLQEIIETFKSYEFGGTWTARGGGYSEFLSLDETFGFGAALMGIIICIMVVLSPKQPLTQLVKGYLLQERFIVFTVFIKIHPLAISGGTLQII